MAKTWGAVISILLLSATAACAETWSESFKIVDTDKSGTISRAEWEANASKLKIDPVPTFSAMDADGNNSIDADEWTAAEKMVKAFPNGCKSATSSWCPKQY